MYIGSFFTSFANFSEFDVGNMISFQIKVFDGNIKQAKLARYFIKVTARPTLRKNCKNVSFFNNKNTIKNHVIKKYKKPNIKNVKTRFFDALKKNILLHLQASNGYHIIIITNFATAALIFLS